ncbi:MAG: MBL fold metallo-hydrolase [Gammaproteobacteria bacterium]|jgi:metallo-beta-lactamase family protein
MKLTFLGAAGTVTGSKYLLETAGRRILIDCGLFQGRKELRLRNWQALPLDPAQLDAVILTHAHIDHTGYLPLLVREGYRGPVYCTEATRDLCGVLLPDSGFLHEEDARYANKRGFSKHHPALPLYTEQQARDSLASLEPKPFDQSIDLGGSVSFRFRLAGHILGAAGVEIRTEGRTVFFSGDVGRPVDPIMYPPEPIESADILIVEATYGNRRHDTTSPGKVLASLVERAERQRGVLLIPSFAVGRAQSLLHLLAELNREGRLHMPVFLNSPMAIRATEIYKAHSAIHRLSPDECIEMGDVCTYVRSVDDSIALNRAHGPMVIISASGMLSGGRVLHHLKAFGGDPRNLIFMVGFQAPGTRGEALENGAAELKIHGEYWPMRASVHALESLSAHADYAELLDWLASRDTPPQRVFITHAEPEAAQAFRQHLTERLGWTAEIAGDGQSVEF